MIRIQRESARGSKMGYRCCSAKEPKQKAPRISPRGFGKRDAQRT
jgi:hypothetical protein